MTQTPPPTAIETVSDAEFALAWDIFYRAESEANRLGGMRAALNAVLASRSTRNADIGVKALDDDTIMEVIRECFPWKTQSEILSLLTYEKSVPMFPQATYDVPSYRATAFVRAIEARIRFTLAITEPERVEPFGWWMSDGASEARMSFEKDAQKRHARASLDWRGNWVETPLYASPVQETVTDRAKLLGEVISLIEDDMYGPGEAGDVAERVAFNKALRRQINRITSRLIVAAALKSTKGDV